MFCVIYVGFDKFLILNYVVKCAVNRFLVAGCLVPSSGRFLWNLTVVWL